MIYKPLGSPIFIQFEDKDIEGTLSEIYFFVAIQEYFQYTKFLNLIKI